MTNRRYRRQTTDTQLSDARERLRVAEHGNPRPTFRAAISDDDLSGPTLDATMRRGYFSPASTDTVFWNKWDDNYNRQFFEPIFTSELGQNCIGAVELLIPGIYAIRATVDPIATDYGFPTVPFNSWVGTNHDDGGVSHIYIDPNSDIIFAWRTDQFRILWPSFTGAESSVEITFAHDNPTDDPLFIPGGFSGYWAFPPLLTIVYLGGLEGDPIFYQNDSLGPS